MIIEGPRSAAPVRECVDESTAPIPSQAGSQWCASAKRDHKAGLVAQANQGRNKTPRHAALIPMDRWQRLLWVVVRCLTWLPDIADLAFKTIVCWWENEDAKKHWGFAYHGNYQYMRHLSQGVRIFSSYAQDEDAGNDAPGVQLAASLLWHWEQKQKKTRSHKKKVHGNTMRDAVLTSLSCTENTKRLSMNWASGQSSRGISFLMGFAVYTSFFGPWPRRALVLQNIIGLDLRYRKNAPEPGCVWHSHTGMRGVCVGLPANHASAFPSCWNGGDLAQVQCGRSLGWGQSGATRGHVQDRDCCIGSHHLSLRTCSGWSCSKGRRRWWWYVIFRTSLLLLLRDRPVFTHMEDLPLHIVQLHHWQSIRPSMIQP